MAYPMGARMMSGQTTKPEELESALADCVGKTDAYLLNDGYQGMVSIIDTLCSRKDVIVYDSDVITSYSIHYTKLYDSFINSKHIFGPLLIIHKLG